MTNTSPPLKKVQEKQKSAWTYVITTGTSTSVPASSIYYEATTETVKAWYSSVSMLMERTDWDDEESRQAYMEACVEQDIAWQICINRKARKLTQVQLARKINTTQTAIARFEDPCYGRHSIRALVKIANAFDCALSVRLIPYSKLAEITKDTSDNAYIAEPYNSEIQMARDLVKRNQTLYSTLSAINEKCNILSGVKTW